MIKGKMVAVGTMNVDGDEMTGCFIECTVDELRNNRADIFCDVEVRAAKTSGSPAEQTGNTGSRAIALCKEISVFNDHRFNIPLPGLREIISKMAVVAQQQAGA